MDSRNRITICSRDGSRLLDKAFKTKFIKEWIKLQINISKYIKYSRNY